MEKMFEKAGIPLHAEEKAEPESVPVGAAKEEPRGENRKNGKKAARTPKRRSVGFRILAASACFLIVISVGTIAAFQSEAVPHIVIEVFQEWYDDFVQVTWGSNQKESMKLEVREPGYLPEGYELVERVEDPNFYSLAYENEEGKKIKIQGRGLISGSLKAEDSITSWEEVLEVNGIECKIGNRQDGSYLGEWLQNDVLYVVIASVDKEELKRVIREMMEK
ncbi:MAG: DUF4367 domain-containing protein [Lachnospiraceae bacterium]|nr:DUF4367 domain-containing protein [Lachnospiraceae bacterium]